MPAKFIGLRLGLTALVMLVTILSGLLIASFSPSFMFWIAIGFLCFIEFIAGLFSVNHYARAKEQFQPSGATVAIVWVLIGLFAITGLLAIGVYWAIRDGEGSGDSAFAGVLIALTTGWSVIATILLSNDLRHQAVNQPVMETRAEHRRQAHSLVASLALLRGITVDDDRSRLRLDHLVKKLEMVDTALSHSHGGGVGAWESGRGADVPPGSGDDIPTAVERITGLIQRISSAAPDDFAPCLENLEEETRRMSLILEQHKLF